MILTVQDFEGRWKLPLSRITVTDFNHYLPYLEIKYIYDLLGVELGDLFIADLVNSVPQSPEFVTIFNPLTVELCGIEYRSNGIKEMLKSFIWVEYTRDLEANANMQGVNISNSENSTKTDFYASIGLKLYNEAVSTFLTIQSYICSNLIDYETFNGQKKQYTTWLN